MWSYDHLKENLDNLTMEALRIEPDEFDDTSVEYEWGFMTHKQAQIKGKQAPQLSDLSHQRHFTVLLRTVLPYMKKKHGTSAMRLRIRATVTLSGDSSNSLVYQLFDRRSNSRILEFHLSPRNWQRFRASHILFILKLSRISGDVEAVEEEVGIVLRRLLKGILRSIIFRWSHIIWGTGQQQ
jgi:hypothetical protein